MGFSLVDTEEQIMVAEIMAKSVLLDNSQSEPKIERDNLKEYMRNDYCTDYEGPRNTIGKFQKMSSTRAVIHPSKLSL